MQAFVQASLTLSAFSDSYDPHYPLRTITLSSSMYLAFCSLLSILYLPICFIFILHLLFLLSLTTYLVQSINSHQNHTCSKRDLITRGMRIIPAGFPFKLSASGSLKPNTDHSHSFSIPLKTEPSSVVTSIKFYLNPLGSMTQALKALVREPYVTSLAQPWHFPPLLHDKNLTLTWQLGLL